MRNKLTKKEIQVLLLIFARGMLAGMWSVNAAFMLFFNQINADTVITCIVGILLIIASTIVIRRNSRWK